MSATISNGVDSFTTLEVTDYEAVSQTLNVYHLPSHVSLQGEGPRSGSLPLLFSSLADAVTAWSILSGASVFTFSYPDLPALDMSFVRDGDMSLKIHPLLRNRWTIDVGYREVT